MRLNLKAKNKNTNISSGSWLAHLVQQGTLDLGVGFKPHAGYRDDLKVKSLKKIQI